MLSRKSYATGLTAAGWDLVEPYVCTSGYGRPQLPDLLGGLPQLPGKVIADEVYATNQVLAAIARHETEEVIPPKANWVA